MTERDFLQKVIPPEVAAELSEQYGVELMPGATFRDALNAKLLQMSADGDQEAAAMARRYGLSNE